MWYGSTKFPPLLRFSKNRRYRLNLRDRRLGKPLPRRVSMVTQSSRLQVPAGWQFTLLRSKLSERTYFTIYFFNDLYFFNVTTLDYLININYSSQSRTFTFFHKHSSYCYYAYLKLLSDVASRFNRQFFLKIRFKGKGYYIYKNVRNTIAPQFGYAHRVYVYSQASTVKFLSKTKVLIFGLSKRDIMLTGYNLKRVKPINIFTGRGVRFARQVIYKKTGKVSSYR